MQPSEQTDPMGAPRRVPTAKDFPKTGPFSLAAPGPRFGARALDLSVVAFPVLIVVAITAKFCKGIKTQKFSKRELAFLISAIINELGLTQEDFITLKKELENQIDDDEDDEDDNDGDEDDEEESQKF